MLEVQDKEFVYAMLLLQYAVLYLSWQYRFHLKVLFEIYCAWGM